MLINVFHKFWKMYIFKLPVENLLFWRSFYPILSFRSQNCKLSETYFYTSWVNYLFLQVFCKVLFFHEIFKKKRLFSSFLFIEFWSPYMICSLIFKPYYIYLKFIFIWFKIVIFSWLLGSHLVGWWMQEKWLWTIKNIWKYDVCRIQKWSIR